MRYIILILILSSAGWLVFVNRESTVHDRAARSLTDSEVIPLSNNTENEGIVLQEEATLNVIEEARVDEGNTQGGSEETESIDTGEDDTDDTEVSEGVTVNVGDQSFVTYINKAIGYRVKRPDKWYWQHYHRSELDESVPVDDYLIMDRAPLSGLEGGYIGEIVIEVSKRPLSDFASNVEGFNASGVTIADISAERYEGMRGESRKIEYHFISSGKTFRIIYTNSAHSEEEEKIFKTFVSSFEFL